MKRSKPTLFPAKRPFFDQMLSQHLTAVPVKQRLRFWSNVGDPASFFSEL